MWLFWSLCHIEKQNSDWGQRCAGSAVRHVKNVWRQLAPMMSLDRIPNGSPQVQNHFGHGEGGANHCLSNDVISCHVCVSAGLSAESHVQQRGQRWPVEQTVSGNTHLCGCPGSKASGQQGVQPATFGSWGDESSQTDWSSSLFNKAVLMRRKSRCHGDMTDNWMLVFLFVLHTERI